jgi:hypothetical protein
MTRSGKGIGDNDLGTGGDELFVRLPHGVGMGKNRPTAPYFAIHGHTGFFKLCSHTPVDDNGRAVAK